MAKKIIKKKPVNSDPFKLTGDEALLLAEACKLDKQRKEVEARLSVIKKMFKDSPSIITEGKYFNESGDTLNFSKRENHTPIDAEELYEVMKKQKVGKFFWRCVKPTLTEVKKYLSETKINKLRKKTDPTPIFSFK
jgi:hypothetical protein